MTQSSSRRNFLVKTSSTAAAVAISSSLAACGGSDDPAVSALQATAKPAEFNFGVASGDPLADRVILWTHAKVLGSNEPVALIWEIASDADFKTVVNSGTVQAIETSGFTAKVDATKLMAGASYFYRFRDAVGTTSAVGITRTLPASNAASVKLAVFSCSLYSNGFFNVYDAAAKSDAQYAVHLGDYIYEYGAEPTKFGNTDSVNGTTAVSLNRVVSPAGEIVSLSDYRTRYALYKSDKNLQALHARMPWITVWDDHEFANDAWVGGAENHDPATQGDWTVRKNTAAQAYHEWMPIRAPDSANLLKIYRRFDFGSLFTLHMLDTRIEGRDRQYDRFGDVDGGIARYVAGLTPNAAGVRSDASRRMISAEQQNWLTTGTAASTATWQILGNQDIMARMWLPESVRSVQGAAGQAAISAYLSAKATRAAAGAAALTPAQTALLNPATNPRLPYNLDAWDGYPANREAIFQAIKAQAKKLVVLSGDSHNGWCTNLTTLAGEKVGVEFATASVTAPGFESAGLGELASSLDGSALVPQLGASAVGAGLGLIDDLNYADTIRRGYVMVTVTSSAVKGEFMYINTVKTTTYTAAVGKTVTVAAAGAVTIA
jgi:alkaline phosphatase D